MGKKQQIIKKIKMVHRYIGASEDFHIWEERHPDTQESQTQKTFKGGGCTGASQIIHIVG